MNLAGKFKYLQVLIFAGIILFSCGFSYKPVKGTYVSLAPNITEVLYAVGAQDNLVAVTTWSDVPEEAKKKPKVGDAFFINKEEIIKRKPEIVFALKEHKVFIDDLKTLGIKIHYFSAGTIEGIYKNITLIGQITGKNPEAEKLIISLKRQEAEHKARKSKKVLFVVHSSPLTTIGKGSFINEIIEKVGHENIAANLNSSYPQVNIEYFIANKPDLVIVTNKESADYLKRYIKADYKIMDYDSLNILLRPGPRIIEAIKIFASY